MMKLEYIQKGDYLFPNIVMEEPEGDIGKYGRLRRTFLQEHRKGRYSGLLLSGKLWAHLVDINEQAKAQMEQLVSEMAAQHGIDEALKAQNQMEWVGRMNNLIAAAEEIVLHELVYCKNRIGAIKGDGQVCHPPCPIISVYRCQDRVVFPRQGYARKSPPSS